MNPLVSIIIVTYNSSDTIVETLDSVYGQTYPNLELIVSDDCSTDYTCDVVRDWMKKHRERFVDVRLLRARKNHGVTKNCNIGIFQAKGKYVQEFGGDDLFMPNAIERKVAYCEEYNLDTVFVKTKPFGPNSLTVRKMLKEYEVGYKTAKQGLKAQQESIGRHSFLVGPSGGFYNREFFIGMGGYDVRYPHLEDYPFLYRYIMSGHELVLIDEYLTEYRVSGDSLCTGCRRSLVKNQIQFFLTEQLWTMIRRREWQTIGQRAVMLYKRYLKSQ